jgi:hypothetical protein
VDTVPRARCTDRLAAEPLTLGLFGQSLVERTKIDHCSPMSAFADLFHFVARRNLEFNSLSFDFNYLGFGTNIMAYRCGGKVSYIYGSADRGLTHIQKWPDCIERGVFHD